MKRQQDQIMRSHCGNPAPALLQESGHRVTPPQQIYMSLLTSNGRIYGGHRSQKPWFQTRISSGRVATLDFGVHSHSPWRKEFWMTSPNVQFLTGKSGWKSRLMAARVAILPRIGTHILCFSREGIKTWVLKQLVGTWQVWMLCAVHSKKIAGENIHLCH